MFVCMSALCESVYVLVCVCESVCVCYFHPLLTWTQSPGKQSSLEDARPSQRSTVHSLACGTVVQI